MNKRAIIFDVSGVLFFFWCNGEIKKNDEILEFIEKNSEKYDFFTNTSLSLFRIEQLFRDYDIEKYFLGFTTRDDGDKAKNTRDILEIYGYKKEDVLFIDDSPENIELVKNTGVKCLQYTPNGESFEKQVHTIFGE